MNLMKTNRGFAWGPFLFVLAVMGVIFLIVRYDLHSKDTVTRYMACSACGHPWHADGKCSYTWMTSTMIVSGDTIIPGSQLQTCDCNAKQSGAEK